MTQLRLFPAYEPAPDSGAIRQELTEQGYANIPLGLGHAACAELFQNFGNFVALCNEPGGEALADAVRYETHDLGNGKYFFEYREPGVNKNEPDRAAGRDHKYVYHFGALTVERATEALGGALPADMATFLENCDQFYTEGSRVMRAGAAALGLEGVMFTGQRADDVHHLRLIDYLASDEPSLGEAHFDRSVVTVAINESGSGLRGVPGQNGYLEPVTPAYIEDLLRRLTPITHNDYIAKFFAGAGLNRLHEHLRAGFAGVPLLGHDITNDRPGERRQAVVMFGNPSKKFKNYSVPDSGRETGFSDILEHLERIAA